MKKTHFDSQDALSCALALLHARGVGPRLTHRLYEHFGSAPEILGACFDELCELNIKPQVINEIIKPNWAAVENDLRWGVREGCFILHYDHPDYPPLLREIHAPPFVLFVRGNIDVLSKPQLAMVGTRTPSTIGCDNAFSFSQSLSTSLVITSGLALGVDGISHCGALEGGGETIAVMGTGLHTVYPKRHKELAYRILEDGALVSEFPPGVGVARENFPRRNRIISGMSLGTLVVEAALKSGSLITARYALEMGREVFALPGSIHNPLARGCHHLIAQGASLVETAQDIFDELQLPYEAPVASKVKLELCLDEQSRRVLSYIGEEVVTIDFLLKKTSLSPGALFSILLILEEGELIKGVHGGVQCTLKKYQLADL